MAAPAGQNVLPLIRDSVNEAHPFLHVVSQEIPMEEIPGIRRVC